MSGLLFNGELETRQTPLPNSQLGRDMEWHAAARRPAFAAHKRRVSARSVGSGGRGGTGGLGGTPGGVGGVGGCGGTRALGVAFAMFTPRSTRVREGGP